MPQGYGSVTQARRPNPFGLRQDLGYVPPRLPSAGGSDGGGGSAGGVIISGGPSGPVITSGRLQTKTISTATYTVTADDLYFLLLFTNAAGCTITIPDDTTLAWAAVLTTIVPLFAFHQSGAGQLTVVGSGATIDTLAIFKPKSFGQFAVMQLVWTAANTWTLFGAQEPV